MSQTPAQFCPFACQLAGSDPFAASLELTGSSTMRFVAARWISFSQVFSKASYIVSSFLRLIFLNHK
jgi:hypothetical protein